MDYTLGEITLFAFFFTPSGWMSCEGQLLTITKNQALFSLIGSTYGGDGKTTFALPNLKGASPLPNMKYYIAIQGMYPQRS
jgi:microcystin-dependent protein